MTREQLEEFLAAQTRLTTTSLSDPINRYLIGLGIGGGILSSLALAKLYARLSPDPEDDSLRTLAKAGMIAVGTGVVSVLWYLNKAEAAARATAEAALANGEWEEDPTEVEEAQEVLTSA